MNVNESVVVSPVTHTFQNRYERPVLVNGCDAADTQFFPAGAATTLVVLPPVKNCTIHTSLFAIAAGATTLIGPATVVVEPAVWTVPLRAIATHPTSRR